MKEQEKMDKTDKYMLVLMALFYLYIYLKNIIGAATHVTGWHWLSFIVLAVIALVFCLFALLISFVLANEAIKYFGLPKNYLVATILGVVISPLSIIILSLVLTGVIPSIFDPRFL